MSKRFAQSGRYSFAMMALLIYMIASICWLCIIKERGELTRAGTIWSICTVMGNCVVGLFIFHERLTTQQGIGIILALTALALLG